MGASVSAPFSDFVRRTRFRKDADSRSLRLCLDRFEPGLFDRVTIIIVGVVGGSVGVVLRGGVVLVETIDAVVVTCTWCVSPREGRAIRPRINALTTTNKSDLIIVVGCRRGSAFTFL